MKRMCNMRMQESCCCCQMMAMTMNGSVYILIGIEKTKRQDYEKNSIYNSIGIEPRTGQRLS